MYVSSVFQKKDFYTKTIFLKKPVKMTLGAPVYQHIENENNSHIPIMTVTYFLILSTSKGILELLQNVCIKNPRINGWQENFISIL